MKKNDRLRITGTNTNYSHAPDYVLDRPDGYDAYVLIHFLSPCEILTHSGIEHGTVGQCILYPPGAPQWNRGTDTALYNNWIHFTGPDAAARVKAYRIPTNRLFGLQNDHFIEPCLKELREEFLGKRPRANELIAALTHAFLIRLGRTVLRRTTEHATTTIPHAETLHTLRARIQNRFRDAWTIEEMAAAAHLSRSRFSVLYKAVFGIAPMEDLIEERLRQASILLSDTPLAIERVAEETGFRSVIYFHRCFRNAFGVPPGFWRKQVCRDTDSGT